MNELQNHGIVSDCCVLLGDVAQADHQAAIDFLSSPKFLGASTRTKPEESDSLKKGCSTQRRDWVPTIKTLA